MPTPIEARLADAGLPPLQRLLWLEIDEDALANNVRVFRELVGPKVGLAAVVKADAYGHGMVPAARALEAAGVDRLCVASLDEAFGLRAAGIDTEILVLFAIPPDGLHEAAHNSIAVSITDAGGLLTSIERMEGEDVISVEVEVETGLSRGGVKVEELPAVLKRVRTGSQGLGPLGFWTHLASPEDEAATAAQVEKFERASALAQAAGELVGQRRHLAATGGALTGRAPTYEGVRIGLGMYGLIPLDLPMSDAGRAAATSLRPAMTLKARALRIERFGPGTSVGYGGRWTTQRDSVIATLPVGYGDSIPRSAPWGDVLVKGLRVPMVGNVAMDAVMVDVTNVPDGVNPEDEFVLLGRQGEEEISAAELARARNTIPWEVATSMSHRVPRVYHAGPVLKGLRTLTSEARVSVTETSIQGDSNG